MQSELSLQFDDLFKKAWEDDSAPQQEDGIVTNTCSISITAYLLTLALCSVKVY